MYYVLAKIFKRQLIVERQLIVGNKILMIPTIIWTCKIIKSQKYTFKLTYSTMQKKIIIVFSVFRLSYS